MTTTTKRFFESKINSAIASMIGSPVHIGQTLPRVGSAVPNGGTVIHIDSVRDRFQVQEEIAGQRFVREVRFVTFRHSARVAGFNG